MPQGHAQGLTDEALDALLDLFIGTVGALADCEGAAARAAPEDRPLALGFTEFYRDLSGQIAMILAEQGKAVDVIGTWIGARNQLLAQMRGLKSSHTGDLVQIMQSVAAPVHAGLAAVLSHPLPGSTRSEIEAMREMLGKVLDPLRRR